MQFLQIAAFLGLAMSVAAFPAADASDAMSLTTRASCPSIPKNCSRCSAGGNGKSNSPKGNMGLCTDKGMDNCVCVMTWMNPDCSACGGADKKGHCQAGDYKGHACEK